MTRALAARRGRVAGPAAMILAVALASPRLARAQTAPQDSAAAQSLYDEGRKWMNDGQFAGACPKLAESQRLDPTQVTEFYLADCYEHEGRTASAWTTFLDVAAVAHRAGRADREKVARDRAAALEPRLTKLTIDVPPAARVAGLVVQRDGEAVGEGQWGAPVAVDPGTHVVRASAPGKRAWSVSEVVAGAGIAVRVATLEDDAIVGGAGDASAQAASGWKAVGVVAIGVGAVGLVVGAVFGVNALSKNAEANDGHCDPTNRCDPAGLALRSDATSAGNVSTAAFVAGGVLVAGGLAAWLLAPSSSVRVAPVVSGEGGGVWVRGAF